MKKKHSKIINGIKMVVEKNGSIRSDDSGKTRPSLIPVHAMIRVGKHYASGAKVHGDRNFERGQYHTRFLDSLYRHLLMYLGGAEDEDHLAALVWNAMAIMQQEELIKRGLLDKKYNNHRELLDENGKQCILKCIFDDRDYVVKNHKKPTKRKK